MAGDEAVGQDLVGANGALLGLWRSFVSLLVGVRLGVTSSRCAVLPGLIFRPI